MPITLSIPLTLLIALAANAEPLVVLRGRVLDPAHTPIAGALVKSHSALGGATQTTRTDERGSFLVRDKPGTYRLTIAAAGFAATSITVVVSEPSTTARDVVMSLASRGEICEAVTEVRAECDGGSHEWRMTNDE